MQEQQSRQPWLPADSRAPTFVKPVLDGKSAALRYGVAFGLVILVATARAALNPWLGTSAPLLPMIVAVMGAAALCGLGPAVFASVLAPLVLATVLVASEGAGDWRPWLAHMGFFTVLGMLLALMVHAIHRANRRLSEALSAALDAKSEASTREAQLQIMSDAMPVLMAFVDRDLRYGFNNREYQAFFGPEGANFTGRRVQDVLSPQAFARAEPKLREALAGRRLSYEATLKSAARGERQLRAHYVPDMAEDGTVRGVFVLAEDLTEEKLTQSKLHDMQQRLSLALRAAKSGSFEWDVATNAMTWSEELWELYGFRAGEFQGTQQAWLACVAPEDRPDVERAMQCALKEGHSRSEFRIRRNDTGEVRWLHARGKVFYDESGVATRMIGINIDVTEHRVIEQARRENEQRLKLIYDNAWDSIFLVDVEPDEQYRFVSVNERFLRVSGYSREQVEGQPLERVIPLSNHELVRAQYATAIRTARPVVYEERADLPAGLRHGRVTLVPIQSPSGTVTHILGAIADITATKEAEAALRVEAKRKDEFIAMLAHELRNPLAPIANIAHLLTSRSVDGVALQRMGSALRRQVTQLTRLVDDLLDVSRITRGVITLRRELVFMDVIAQSAVETLMPTILSRRQQVKVRALATDLTVHGDTARLTQVISNLLSNASKYSADDTVIELTLDRSGDEAIVSVRDRGIGIDAQMLPQIFDLFVQADRSIDRKDSGLGVGLTIVRRLVEMHNGKVSARSDGLGRGSEFTVRLPLLIMPSLDRSTHVRVDNNSNARASVLVVDDNVDSAETLALILRSANHDVHVAHDAAGALQAVEKHSLTVAFLDVGLPDMDGCMLAQTIRERRGNSIRLVALTGYAAEADRTLALESGFDHHVTKPADPARVLQLANEVREFSI